MITYPRTDSRYLSHDMLPNTTRALKALDARYQALVAPLLTKPLPKHKRVFDDSKVTDHHAIIPTGRKADVSTLPADEGKLFDLIARRLIAAFYPPFVYSATRIITECEGYSFLSTGTTVVHEGFKAVYRDTKAKKDKKDDATKATLPPLQEGDMRKASPVKTVEDKTKPPKEYTDATLLSGMEHAGRSIEDETLRNELKGCSLGTPATRAAIIERLMTVGYAKRKGRQILATQKGVQLIQAVPSDIASPETTGKWEQALERIAGGEGDDARFMEGIKRLTSHLTKYASTAPNVSFPQEEGKSRSKSAQTQHTLSIPCPLCQKGEVTENTKAFGCTLWREGCTFTIWKNSVSRVGGPELTENLIKALYTSETGTLRGSTGTLYLQNGRVCFAKNAPMPETK